LSVELTKTHSFRLFFFDNFALWDTLVVHTLGINPFAPITEYTGKKCSFNSIFSTRDK